MTKRDKFSQLQTESDFSVRDTIDVFVREEDPERIGRKLKMDVAAIDLDRIITKDQVRKDYNPQKHAEMVASLTTHKQKQPAVVWYSKEDQRYVIFMGHRRFRAAKEVEGMNTLDCVIVPKPTEAERIELQLVENLIREDLNPVDEARAYADIIRVRGCTAKDLAKEIGKNPSTLTRSIKMLELPEDILAEIGARKIPKSVAREIQKLKTEDEQRALLAEWKDGGTYGQVAQQVQTKTGTARKTAKTFTKKHTYGGITIKVIAKKRPTQSDIAEALRAWAVDLDNDGRGKRAA